MVNENDVIVFFDGYCNLCNKSVDFIIRKEAKPCLKFASLQSKYAKELFDRMSVAPKVDSIVLFVNNQIYTKSDAAVYIAKFLKLPYSALSVFKFVPHSIRDFIYDWVAKNRYSWFGKRSTCRLPSEKERKRFLG